MDSVKGQLKTLILKGLRITGVTPEEFQDDRPLMGGDLEIDSVDVLQLILEIERHFGIKLVSGKFDRHAWENINTLAASIERKLNEAGGIQSP